MGTNVVGVKDIWWIQFIDFSSYVPDSFLGDSLKFPHPLCYCSPSVEGQA
jgi:hypothetical protein